MSDTRRPSDKRVANIPTLDGIKDPAIRAVLEPLVQGWNVRNGQSPITDEHRFITKADLNQWTLDGTLLNGMFKGVSLTTGQVVPGSGGTATQQAVNSIVNSAVNEVQNSPFWQFLGRRIEEVALPMTAFKLELGKMQTAQYNETQSRYNMNTAILSSLTQLFAGIPGGPNPIWSMKTNGTELITTQIDTFARDYTDVRSTANGASAAVLIETETRASETGDLFGQYSVKVDLDGYVSGFGISASANNNVAGSEFYVRADRFAIGGPEQVSGGTRHTGQFLEYTVKGRTYRQEVLRPPGPANIPFVVVSGDFEYRGRQVNGGVFLTNAFIQNGAIGTAQIGLAQIDSLAVGQHQITVPYFNNSGDTAISAQHPSFGELTNVNVIMPENQFRDGYVESPSGIIICASFWFQPTGNVGNYDIHARLIKGTTTLSEVATSVVDGFSGMVSFSAVDPSPSQGDNRYYLEASWGFAGSDPGCTAHEIVIYALGAFR